MGILAESAEESAVGKKLAGKWQHILQPVTMNPLGQTGCVEVIQAAAVWLGNRHHTLRELALDACCIKHVASHGRNIAFLYRRHLPPCYPLLPPLLPQS